MTRVYGAPTQQAGDREHLNCEYETHDAGVVGADTPGRVWHAGVDGGAQQIHTRHE